MIRRGTITPRLAPIGLCFGLVLSAACEDDVKRVGGQSGNTGTGTPSPSKQPAPEAPKDAGAAIELTEEDFVEDGTNNRDPFRSFAETFEVEAPEVVQRRVLMPDTSIDQMRLIAIISGVSQPRAMLTDPSNVGHVVKRGDYIGRAEVVQTGSGDGMPVTLNWRVERIRADELVLTRKDPTSPDEPPLRRVIPLYKEKERAELKLEQTRSPE